MFKNILVGLDGSTHSQVTLEMAIHLARRLGARLHGLHVINTAYLRGPFFFDLSGAIGIEPQMNTTSQLEAFLDSRATDVLGAFEERCRKEGIGFRTSRRTGDPVEVLTEEADLNDLVMVGRRGVSYDLNPSLDSGRGSARQLLRQSATPLVLTGTSWHPLRKIMVAYDGSPGSHRALKDAARLATGLELSLVVAYVREAGMTPSYDPLAEAQHYLDAYPLDASLLEREGARIGTLAALSIEADCQMLFGGYQGTSRLRELFIGHAPDVLLNWIDLPMWVSK